MIVWIIGLAGAGKTVIGKELHGIWKEQDKATVFLDGDHVREIMGNDLGHTLEDRRVNAWRICRLCRYFDQQGINVVCSILSLFAEHRAWNRETYSDYFEIFVDVPMDVLAARDQKGLYSGAKAGKIRNVVGFDIAFTPPSHPDMTVSTQGDLADVRKIAADIYDAIRGRRGHLAP